MSAETITPFQIDPSTATPSATVSDASGGGAGRGGSQNGSGSPLVVVQQPRAAAPPRPAPSRSQGNTDNSLRNGYAAISHTVSGQTAAIGLGFLVGGPVGAVIGGVAAPAALAAVMWRSRRREHDENTNQNGASSGNTGRNRDSSGSGRGNGGRNNNGTGHHNSPGGRHRTPNGHGNGNGTDRPGNHHKPKVKDPVADKLARLTKDLGDKLKNRDKADKAPKNGKHDGTGGTGKGGTDPKDAKRKDLKTPKDSASKGRKWLKDRGPQPGSTKPWEGRGDKPKKDKKTKDKPGKDDKRSRDSGDVTAESAPDGLPPGPAEDRIDLVRDKREKERRRDAKTAGREAGKKAARDGSLGDPYEVTLEVIREKNHRVDLELQYENELLALTAAAERPRSIPVNYPAIQAAPVATRTAGAAVARQIDFRGSQAFAILRAMADQIAHGLHNDDDADMGDHIVELTGIPNMCKNLSLAVQEATHALNRTAPLHPSVIKHLNNAAIAARTAGAMADTIMVVFVQAHREDIIRVLDPRIGEERWNLRNAAGTLDAAKLRAAISSAHSARLALPAGTSGGAPSNGGSKLVPASDGSTKKLISLMKDFTRGHMVVVLSEVAGAAAGVEVVADSVTRLYRRMARTWPTEGVVDETVRATAAKVHAISDELKKAIKAAQRAHERELRLNAKPRKGALAERKWDVTGRRPSS